MHCDKYPHRIKTALGRNIDNTLRSYGFIELYKWYTAEAGWRLIYALWRHETDPGYWKNAISSDEQSE